MGRDACLHGNHCVRIDLLLHRIDPVVSLAGAPETNRPKLIDRMELENVLGEINTDNSNRHGSAPHQRPVSCVRNKVSGVHPIAYRSSFAGTATLRSSLYQSMTRDLIQPFCA